MATKHVQDSFNDRFEVAGAGVLHKAMSVVNVVSEASGPIRISDLLEKTGLPLGTLHRLLSALVSERLLKQDPRSKSYALGSRISELASNAVEHVDVAKIVGANLEELNGLTGESVAVALVEGDQVVYRAKRDGTGLLRISVKVGERLPLQATAMGKAVLAFMDPDQFQRAMRRTEATQFTAQTLVDAHALETDLAQVRQSGIAVENEEHFAGVRSIAAPLLDRRGYAIGAVSIIAPAVNMTAARMENWKPRLADTARKVAIQLGGTPPDLNPSAPEPRAMPAGLEVRLKIPAYLGSSPLWDSRNGRLYWIDVLAPSVNIFDLETGRNEAIPMDDLVGGIGLHGDAAKLVVALRAQIGILDLSSHVFSPLASAVGESWEHRFNKGGCDAAGRFWTSNMHMGGLPGAASLFRISPEGTIQTMDTGMTLPNALAWSPDNTVLYLTDSAARAIYAYDFDLVSGQIGERTTLVEVPAELGRPSGLAVDADGCLWSTHSDGWRVTRYSPDGKVLSFLGLPVPSANGCGFGGRDFQTLFITSARDRMSPRRIVNAPLSGSLFSYPTGLKGSGLSRFGETGRS